jgi:hypothetical protein
LALENPQAASCTCEAHNDADPTAHHDACDGAQPCGWRARMPETLREYATELLAADEMPERTFAGLVVETAGHARHGADWERV